jgi:hypothetical protein
MTDFSQKHLLSILLTLGSISCNALIFTCPTPDEIRAGVMVGTDEFEVTTADNATFWSKRSNAALGESAINFEYADESSYNGIVCKYANISLTLDEKKSQAKNCSVSQELPPAEKLLTTTYASTSGFRSGLIHRSPSTNPKSITIKCQNK